MAKYVDAAKQDIREDVTWQKAGRLSRRGIKEFPEASVQYLLDKAPIIGWLPKYNPRWLINDAIAGLTLGLMLIPQGLAYAKIAEIPVEYGLMSSWLPASIYAIMGTTKGEFLSDIMPCFVIYTPLSPVCQMDLSSYTGT